MRPRHPLPRLWLMTDERQGDALLPALERLPRGAGVVFRHHKLPPAERRALFGEVRRTARRRGLVLVSAGTRLSGADGVHNGRGAGLRTASAHDVRELRAAERAGADLIFVSPVFETRSHPGATVLGHEGFRALARRTRLPVIALGGMTEARFRALHSAYGWAAIDALTCLPARSGGRGTMRSMVEGYGPDAGGSGARRLRPAPVTPPPASPTAASQPVPALGMPPACRPAYTPLPIFDGEANGQNGTSSSRSASNAAGAGRCWGREPPPPPKPPPLS